MLLRKSVVVFDEHCALNNAQYAHILKLVRSYTDNTYRDMRVSKERMQTCVAVHCNTFVAGYEVRPSPDLRICLEFSSVRCDFKNVVWKRSRNIGAQQRNQPGAQR